MSSRLATPLRMRPDLSFHWTSTISAHNIRGSIRLSNIHFLSASESVNDYERCATKIALTRRKALTAKSVTTEYHDSSGSTRRLAKFCRVAIALSLTGL